MNLMIRSASLILAITLGSAGLIFAQTPPKPQAPKPTSPPRAPGPKPPAPSKATSGAAQDEQIPPASPDALFPAVAARVNGKAILGRDLEQRIQSQLAPIGNPSWNNLREEYRAELASASLGNLVAAELIYQKATTSGIKVSDAEVQAELAKVGKTFSSDAEMNRALAERGMDRAALTKEIEKTLIVTKFVQETITKKIVVEPAEVSKYYSTHTEEFRHPDLLRTSHILILVPEGATPEQDRIAKLRAEALLVRVKKGEDFAKLAKENSMDGSASQGGDIGQTPKGQLAPEYEAAAFALPVGGISDVVRTQFGYHIIKVMDKKKEGLSTLDEVRSELTDFLKQQETDADLETLVKDLRTQAKIDIFITLHSATSSPGPR